MLPRKTISAEGAHVVMLVQYLPLHFISTMQKLSKKIGRLTLVLSEPMDASRDWQPDFSGLNVIVQKSLRIPVKHRHPLGFEDDGAVIIPYSTLTDLRKLQPDVVIAVEVGARTLQAALLKELGASFKLIVQVRESENTASSRGVIRRGVRRFLLPRADQVFVNGNSGRKHALACGVDAARVSVVPSGTDTLVFGRNQRVRSTNEELKLLYVGQLIPRKGVVPFAKALAAVAATSKRRICWSIAGRGPQQPDLLAIQWPENVRLELLGSKPYQELPQYYEQADVFVMPSLSDEWGLVVNEAMASGLPVLGCTGAQSVEELVKSGESGWTYEPGDDAALRTRLATLLSTSQDDLVRMGQEARRTAMEISDDFAASVIVGGIKRVLAMP
jgi:glycosyltransferase involved in cell wall biosynthesis